MSSQNIKKLHDVKKTNNHSIRERLRLWLLEHPELNPYRFNPFVIDKALATAIEVLIPENFPGPWFTNTWLNSLNFILFSLIKSNNNKENLSLLFLLASKDLL